VVVGGCGSPVAGWLRMTNQLTPRGFTLVETLIATGILITAIAGLAQLFALSVRFTRDSSQFGAALIAAQDKLEILRSLRFGYDEDGRPVTDPRLQPSRDTSLHENVGSHFEWLNDDGSVGAERGSSYVRRWRITEIAANEPAVIAIDVCVYAAPAYKGGPNEADACLGSVRVRQP
jgi:type II secretory pathway pseudopilin PulG